MQTFFFRRRGHNEYRDTRETDTLRLPLEVYDHVGSAFHKGVTSPFFEI